jgi:hypothetical protein
MLLKECGLPCEAMGVMDGLRAHAGVVKSVLGALAAHLGRTGATDPLGARFEATRGPRVRVGGARRASGTRRW